MNYIKGLELGAEPHRKKLRSVSIFIYTWMERDKVEGDLFEKKYLG